MPRQTLFDRPIAHRGLHDRATGVIENSASAFAAAIARGYAIECDVQLTKDRQAIVFHDDELDRLTKGSGPVGALTASELATLPLNGSSAGDCPQPLPEMLTQIDGRTLLVIEIKQQPTPEASRALALAVVKALTFYHGPVVLESFDPDILVAARKAGFRGQLGVVVMRDLNEGASPLAEAWLRHMLHWPLTRFQFISAQRTDLDLPMIRLCRCLRMPVTSWTIRSVAEAELARSGADQIVFEGFLPALG